MNRTQQLGGKLGIVLCSALLGCTSYGQPSVSVGVSVPLPSAAGVEIRADSDFYEPLTPYGRWEVVGTYGRCWIPGGVAADWRPYCDGNWQRTDAGWYWASDEPWAWATYHYGRWNLSAEFGWYWVPQTQWAPAWVSWHSGGGYIGWAPLYPSGVRTISPRAYVFVEERHFMEPVRHSTVIVNNTTIIQKTVINQGPATAFVEKATGRKIQAVGVQELRHKEEAPVVARQRARVPAVEKQVQTPVRSEAGAVAKKTVVAREPARVEKPAVAPHEDAKALRAVAQTQPETKPQGNRPASIPASTGQKAGKHVEKQAKPARQIAVASEKREPNTADKNHENKANE